MNRLTLPVSVSKLIESIGDQTTFTPKEIIRLVKDADIKKKDLMEFAHFDHDKKEGYGRHLVHKGKNFEIMVMSWAPLDATAIHNHGYTEWGAVKTFGKLEHTSFEYKNSCLTTLFKEKLSKDEVIAVNQNLIHQMANFSGENVISLHIYGTSLAVDGITDNSHLYELGKGEVQVVDGGVFYDLPKSEIAIANNELYTDRLTLIGHYTSLLNHYLKTGERGPQYLKAINFFHDRSFESRLITELEMDSKDVLYTIELRKAKKVLQKLSESTKTIDAILFELSSIELYS
ncbi:cysteine dioxygenase family protein [Paracrocinitomix mangrovi]|uniref:cysteine dioxygenase n=1 Tax=Paracrocinitomix mangrovi TaxID=2862509 RepID=UPI001C8D83FB|nr:cysteine dioxygenase family protein [Paracrocinitomix mangrovi]UKN03383.1 cysteine dioxygenase family protein [Paracrocinitomix mangrovi]